MLRALNRVAAAVLPGSAVRRLRFYKSSFRYRSAKRAFRAAQPDSGALPIADLVRLQAVYPVPAAYGYEPEVRSRRGRERAQHLLGLIPDRVDSVLELGCSDGMVGYHLRARGKAAVGIDQRAGSFDPRAIEAGVELLQMDAERLTFADGSFDCVTSYNSFEHFSDPARVLAEACRVVKPGGYIFLDFGPLYLSPMGLHAYRKITVPYCQILFSHETLSEFLEAEALEPINFDHCNAWSLVQFRELWESFAERLERVRYIEEGEYHHLDLIGRYPSIFRDRTDEFDDLICSSIEVLFRKR